jgi:Protein of unknown function (DUF3631)
MNPDHIPTPDTPRDNGDIITRVEDFLNTYVAFPKPEQATVCALWVIHTFAFEAAYATPYIYVNSAEPQCGKTRLIEAMDVISRNSELAANLTASSLFRALDSDVRPTLFIDEVDTIFAGKSNEELRSVLNSGYKYNGYVTRTLPGKNEDSDVVKFSTFCPKLLAGIDNGQMPPTIADRCIPVILKRKRKDQDVARFLPRKVEPVAAELKTAILEWVLANMDGIVSWEPDTDDEFVNALSDRSFEIVEPLVQIAMQAGPEYAKRAKAAIIEVLTGKADKVLTPAAKCLAMARDLMSVDGDIPRQSIQTATLAEALGTTPKQVAAWLDKYEIKPQIITFGGTRARGFYRNQFEDAWERYL